MKNKIEDKSYYIILIILSAILIVPTRFLGIDTTFAVFYNINYQNINNAMITIFSVLFAFIFTVLAILFSLKEDSLFFKLIEKNKRNKKDIINYFILSILFLAFVLIMALFLTVTYVGNTSIVDSQSSIVINQFNQFNQNLIYALVYFMEIALANIILLLITFVAILRD